MNPVQVDVIMPLPEGWGLCSSCELMMASADLDRAPSERALESFPPEWQPDLEHLQALLAELTARYAGRVLFRLYDPRSLPGLFKAIWHGARRYPTFIVDGGVKVNGWDEAGLQSALACATQSLMPE
jgi:hypothetical protein